MSKIITLSDLNSTKFYQLPKAFFHNEIYSSMKNESKICYSLLRDLLDLSAQNKWYNEDYELYVKLSRKKMMQYLNVKGWQKMTQIMDELKKKGLIIERQVGVQKCNEIYVCIPDEIDIVYSNEELLENENVPGNVENTVTFENQSSGVLKIKGQELRKSKVKTFENQRHTNTNNTKTNLTNTNISTSTGNKEEFLNSIEKFEKTICPLRKTTLPKFENILNTYGKEFVDTVVDVISSYENKTYSFKGFETAAKSYIEKGLVTKETILKDKSNFDNSKNRKNKSYNKKPSVFNDYQQREYDFDDLEDKLVTAAKSDIETENINGEDMLAKIRNKEI